MTLLLGGLYPVLCTVYIILGLNINQRLSRLVLKCLPILVLIAWVLSYLAAFVKSPDSVVDVDSKTVEREKVTKVTLLVWALVFSVIGDGFLVFPKVFPFGLLSFTAAQCVYIRIFGVDLATIASMSWQAWASLVLVVVMTCAFLTVFHRQMQRIGASFPRRFSLLSTLVAIYFMLLAVMLWSSVLRFQMEVDLPSFVGVLGGALFYISDILIAVVAVWKVYLLKGREMIMITYYSAQFAIVLSFLYKV